MLLAGCGQRLISGTQTSTDYADFRAVTPRKDGNAFKTKAIDKDGNQTSKLVSFNMPQGFISKGINNRIFEVRDCCILHVKFGLTPEHRWFHDLDRPGSELVSMGAKGGVEMYVGGHLVSAGARPDYSSVSYRVKAPSLTARIVLLYKRGDPLALSRGQEAIATVLETMKPVK